EVAISSVRRLGSRCTMWRRMSSTKSWVMVINLQKSVLPSWPRYIETFCSPCS
ncbi:hypothetical protein LTR20_001690, partial [Exophiala xenobiotica]